MENKAFANVLTKTVASTEAPKPVPVGTYLLVVKDFEFGESSKKKTPFLRVNYGIIAPGQDVDPTQLAGFDLAKKNLRDEFYLTDDALFRLRAYIENSLGIAIGQRNYGDIIANDLKGKQVNASVIQEPSERPGDTTMYNRISGYAKVS
jgi:hypothetical protein